MKSDEGIRVILPNNDASKNRWELALHVVMLLKRSMEAIDTWTQLGKTIGNIATTISKTIALDHSGQRPEIAWILETDAFQKNFIVGLWA